MFDKLQFVVLPLLETFDSFFRWDFNLPNWRWGAGPLIRPGVSRNEHQAGSVKLLALAFDEVLKQTSP